MRRPGAMLLLIMLCIFTAGAGIASTLVIPTGITTIEAETFQGNHALDVVIVPDTVTSILESAFADSSLRKIVLPDSLEYIEPSAFELVSARPITFVVPGSDTKGSCDTEKLVRDVADYWDWTEDTDYTIQYADSGKFSAKTFVNKILAVVPKTKTPSTYNGNSSTNARKYDDILKKGTDCSGLVYLTLVSMGYKTEHPSLPWGTNSLWRNTDCIESKGELNSATVGNIAVGDLLFKARADTSYSGGYDIYHVGVVVDTNPLKVAHASDSANGIILTEITGYTKWNRWARLSDLNYGDF